MLLENIHWVGIYFTFWMLNLKLHFAYNTWWYFSGQLSQIIQWVRYAYHCWRKKDKLIRDILLWTPTWGHTSGILPEGKGKKKKQIKACLLEAFCCHGRCLSLRVKFECVFMLDSSVNLISSGTVYLWTRRIRAQGVEILTQYVLNNNVLWD